MKTLLVYTFLLLFSFSICYLIYFLFKKLWRIKIPGIREKVVEEKEPKNRLHLNTKNFIKLFSISIFIATIIACITLIATVYNGGRIVNSINNDTIKVDTTDTALTNGFKGLSRMEKIDILMDAISEVESHNNSNAKSNTSSAAGHLQILKIAVDQCNIILKEKGSKKRYSYSDRYSKKEAEEMFILINEKYNPKNSVEIGIRLWNQGPTWTTTNSQDYYEKVIKVYNRKMEERLGELSKKLIESTQNLN